MNGILSGSVNYEKEVLETAGFKLIRMEGPLVLFDSKKIDPEFISAFDYFLETYPDLKTAETIETFQVELKAT